MISIVLLSDVHANIEALDAVLAHARDQAPHAARYHLGDLVGYSANPNEVIARLDAEQITGVAGNYDSTVAHGYKHCGCRSENARQEQLAHESYAWTLANTSAESRARLAALPFRLDVRPLGGHTTGPRFVLLHAHSTSNLIYVTEDRTDDFLRKLGESVDAKSGDLVAFGHTHKPWHRVIDGVHYVNSGSVGRPKDHDPRAGYVRVDVAAGGEITLTFERVPYNVEGAAATVIAVGLPVEFADFLRTGGKG